MNDNNNISPDQLEQIERYLQQQMSAEEQQAFVAKLSSDASLKQATDELRLLFVGVQEAALQQRLDQFHEGVTTTASTSTAKVVRMPASRKWAIAASLLIVVTVAAWLFFTTGNKKDLYATYYQPDPGLISAMGNSDNYTFDRAMVEYKTGNYTGAIKVWDSLLATQPNSDTLHYFLGSAYLANNETGKAMEQLQQVVDKPNSPFVYDANWYMGLALLKSGKPTESIPYLQQSQHPKKEELLKTLTAK